MKNRLPEKQVIEILNELRGTNSKLDKVRILKKNFSNDLLIKVLLYTYNPFNNYYIRKLEKIKDDGDQLTIDSFIKYPNRNIWSIKDAFSLLEDLMARKITGNEALQEVTEVYQMLNPAAKELLLLMLDRSLSAGFSASTVNKVWKGLIPEFKVALASGEKDIKHIKYPAICQLKGDGRRTIVMVDRSNSALTTFKIFTRSGKRDEKLETTEYLKQFERLSEYVSDSTRDITGRNSSKRLVFDCEVIMESADGSPIDRKISNGIMNRLEIDNKYFPQIKFLVWDVISQEDFDNKISKDTYGLRFDILSHALLNFKNIKLIQSQFVNSIDEAKTIAAKYIEDGYEGAMLKNINAVYEGKRTKNQIKIKAEREADLVVTGWQEGTGIMKGYMGALICESSDGKLKVNIGSGFSHNDRGFEIVDTATMETKNVQSPLDKDRIIGKVITVKYNEVIQNASGDHSLFLPRFVEIRTDKNEADKLEKIINEI